MYMEVDSLFQGSAGVKAVEVEGSVVPALLLVVSSRFFNSNLKSKPLMTDPSA